MKKILFSPVGRTDPYRGGFDGPLLHIVRHYKPEEVCLLLSKEIRENEEKDQRYSLSIQKLAELLEFNCEIVLKYSDVDDPSDFDGFLHEFKACITGLQQDNPGADILLNISSGTPQMESTLCIIASTGEQILRCIQVKTPENRSNVKLGFTEDFDAGCIENLLDNLPEAQNRCVEPEILSYRNSYIHEKVKGLISNFDYSGALQMAGIYKGAFSEPVLAILRHLDKRLKWDIKGAEKEVQGLDSSEEWYSTKNPKARSISEYYLCMKIKYLRGELTDFVLRISPLLAAICEDFIEEVLKFPLDGYIAVKQGIRKITRNKLSSSNRDLLDHLDAQYNGGYRDTFVSFSLLLVVMKYEISRKGVGKEHAAAVDNFESMRTVEAEVRNVSAHQMEHIGEDFIRSATGMSPKRIMQVLESLILMVYRPFVPRDFSNKYERLNEMAINMISSITSMALMRLSGMQQ